MKDQFLTQMGLRLMNMRKQATMTQEDLAEATGLNPKTISGAETGTQHLRAENIAKICATLDMSADYLLMGKIFENNEFEAKYKKLSPKQQQALMDIIDLYFYACE